MPSEAQKRQLVSKLDAFATKKFGGNMRSAFDHYAAKNGVSSLVDEQDLVALFGDAGIGWTDLDRKVIAQQVLEEVDKDGDGQISFHELEATLAAAR